MSEYMICRICLRIGCKMYQCDRFHLKLYYEELMSLKIDNGDDLPQYFCYECATLLRKFRKFKERCYVAVNMLKEIKWIKGITYTTVSQTNRLLVQSPLEMLAPTKRIRSYTVKDKSYVQLKYDSESEEKDIPEPCINVSEELLTNLDNNLGPITDPFARNSNNVNEEEPKIYDNTLNTSNIKEECYVNISDTDDQRNNDDFIQWDDDLDSKTIENLKVKDTIHNEISNKSVTETVSIKKEIQQPKKVKKVSSRKNKKTKEVYKNPQNGDDLIDFTEYGLPIRNPKLIKVKQKCFLNLDNWKIIAYSKEEAVVEFKKKADEPKYQEAPFKCTDCFKWFAHEDIWKRHNLMFHSESCGSRECYFCHSRFKRNHNLRCHLRQHVIKYECQICGRVCPQETTALMHQDYHDGVVWKCKQCGMQFKYITSYYTHLRTHRSEHVCTLCGVSFVSPSGLRCHKRLKHVGETEKAPEATESDIDDTFCVTCNIRFETVQAYDEHFAHSALHVDGTARRTDEAEISAPVETRAAKVKVAREFKLRKRVGEGAPSSRGSFRKRTTCYQCGRVCESYTEYLQHHKKEHPRTPIGNPADRRVCEVCGISLSANSVMAHAEIHTRNKKFKCDICGRECISNITFKRHLLTHTGVKPYQCPACDKRFTQSGSMKLHYRTVHLKEPYPKRNRRKKEPLLDTTYSSDDSDEQPLRKQSRFTFGM